MSFSFFSGEHATAVFLSAPTHSPIWTVPKYVANRFSLKICSCNGTSPRSSKLVSLCIEWCVAFSAIKNRTFLLWDTELRCKSMVNASASPSSNARNVVWDKISAPVRNLAAAAMLPHDTTNKNTQQTYHTTTHGVARTGRENVWTMTTRKNTDTTTTDPRPHTRQPDDRPQEQPAVDCTPTTQINARTRTRSTNIGTNHGTSSPHARTLARTHARTHGPPPPLSPGSGTQCVALRCCALHLCHYDS